MRPLGWTRKPEGEPSLWVDAALAAYEDRTLTRVTVARTVMFATILVWLLLYYGATVAVENALPLGAFIALGLAAFGLMHGRPRRRWLSYLFVVADALLLAYTLLTPGRVYPDVWPWQMVLRQPNFLYFLTLPALATLTFRPFLVLWAGIVVVVVWASGSWVIATAPGAVVGTAGLPPAFSEQLFLERYLQPTYVHPEDLFIRVFVTLLVVAILAYGASRARDVIHEQAEAARERANLARYVAPKMVERLARSDNPLAMVRSQEVSVLFADVRGFTAMAETLGPVGAMGLLRAFHGRMAECVFAHDGTLDKFIGDGLMATFGTPEAAPDDARRAIGCAGAMLASLEDWNRERTAAGDAPIEVGIGLHHGLVTMGDIGGAQRFEFAVIGDTVNVANRLEELTRSLGSPLLVSDAALHRAQAAGADLRRFVPAGQHLLRGRTAPLEVWAALPAKTSAPACL
jgi:adenylate cyclase